MRFHRWLFLAAALAVALGHRSPVHAYNHPDVEWRTLETENFIIHFHEGARQTAWRLAVISEEMGPKVEDAFRYHPSEKIHLVVRDLEDTANGFAVYDADWITIWSTNLYYPLRGRHDWLRNVFTHEYTHIISLKASQSWAEGIAGLLINGLAAYVFDRDRYSIGYSLVLAGGNEPTWWTEGIAEYVTDDSGENRWSTNRDMLLRMSLLENMELTSDEMSTIADKWGFDGERIYNSGYNLCRYIDSRFGHGRCMDLAGANALSGRLEWNQAIEDRLGMEWEDLYRDWIDHLRGRYQEFTGRLGSIHEGSLLVHLWDTRTRPEERDVYDRVGDSVTQFGPQISPDGSLVAFSIGSEIRGYHVDMATLRRYAEGDHAPEEIEYVQEGHTYAEWMEEKKRREEEEENEGTGIGVEAAEPFIRRFTSPGSGPFSFSPDSRHLVWADNQDEEQFWAIDGPPRYDLYIGSIDPTQPEYLEDLDDSSGDESGKGLEIDDDAMVKSRISADLRATQPSWSPDGKEIAFVQTLDGRDRIGAMAAQGARTVRWILDFHQDAQIGGLHHSPDGRWIAFHMFVGGQQDLWRIRTDGTGLEPLTWGSAEERDPRWCRDGGCLLFSADYNNVFNIYRMDLATGRLTRLTNVVSGAFTPADMPSGDVLYSHFTSYGFKIYLLLSSNFDNTPVEAPWATMGWPIRSEAVWRQYDQPRPDLQPAESREYSAWESLQPVQVVPTIRIDDDFFQVGAEASMSDYLGKHQIFGRAEFGDSTDMVAQYANSVLTPDLYFTASHLRFADTLLLPLFDPEDPGAPLFRERAHWAQDTVAASGRMQLTEHADVSASLYARRTEISRETLGFLLGESDPLTFGNRGRTALGGLSWFDFRDARASDAGINPHDGTALGFSLAYSESRFRDSLADASSQDYHFVRVLTDWTEFYPMESLFEFMDGWRHTLEFNLSLGATDRNVEGFDEYFAGGELPLIQSRSVESNSQFAGYRRLALSGETLAIANANYRFPLVRDIGLKTGWWYFSNLYAQAFGSAGNIWGFRPDGRRERPLALRHDAIRLNVGGDTWELPFLTPGDTAYDNGNRLLYDAGFELRLEGAMLNRFSFDSFMRVAWGFQDLELIREADDGTLTRTRRYRGEAGPLYYLGIGTGW